MADETNSSTMTSSSSSSSSSQIISTNDDGEGKGCKNGTESAIDNVNDASGDSNSTVGDNNKNQDDDGRDNNNNNNNNNSSGNDSSSNDNTVQATTTTIISREDLIELIKAIKFALPDSSQRYVYNEIVTTIPQKFPQFASSLQTVSYNDVRKVWKKATSMMLSTTSTSSSSTTNSSSNSDGSGSNNNNNNNNANADLMERLQSIQGSPQLYTVGDVNMNCDEGSSTTRTSITTTTAATEYMIAFLQSQQQQQDQQQQEKDEQSSVRRTAIIYEDYVHVYLNVPADTSGRRPHQALINFQQKQQQPTTTSKGNTGTGSNKKKLTGKKKKTMNNTNTNNNKKKDQNVVAIPPPPTGGGDGIVDEIIDDDESTIIDRMMIVKIQMALPLSEQDTMKHPMLVYDESRTYKTFIHYHPKEEGNDTKNNSKKNDTNSNNERNNNSNTDNDRNTDDSNDDDVGYMKIAKWIEKEGTGGVLGQSGGTKAYFYSRVTKPVITNKTGGGKKHNMMDDILSIYVKEIAPPQPW